MILRTAILAAALTALAAPAFAQEASFKNPSPVDFSQPFLYDGVFVRPQKEDSALEVEVIGRDRQQLGNPSLDEIMRSINSPTNEGTSTINLRNLGAGRTLIMLNGKRLADDPALKKKPEHAE